MITSSRIAQVYGYAVCLIAVILMQRSEGGALGMGGAFIGLGPNSARPADEHRRRDLLDEVDRAPRPVDLGLLRPAVLGKFSRDEWRPGACPNRGHDISQGDEPPTANPPELSL